jgi:hypothetical protein
MISMTRKSGFVLKEKKQNFKKNSLLDDIIGLAAISILFLNCNRPKVSIFHRKFFQGFE